MTNKMKLKLIDKLIELYTENVDFNNAMFICNEIVDIHFYSAPLGTKYDDSIDFPEFYSFIDKVGKEVNPEYSNAWTLPNTNHRERPTNKFKLDKLKEFRIELEKQLS